jgi:hypothetical protein
VIQLNEKLVYSEVSNVRLHVETDKDNYDFEGTYYAGDLILPTEVIDLLTTDSIKVSRLMFDVYSYKGDRMKILNVKTNFSKVLLDQPFVVLNVYDFRDKKYKRQLGHLTQDNYICEYIFPGSGLYLRRK